jgi:hypothetical protein
VPLLKKRFYFRAGKEEWQYPVSSLAKALSGGVKKRSCHRLDNTRMLMLFFHFRGGFNLRNRVFPL